MALRAAPAAFLIREEDDDFDFDATLPPLTASFDLQPNLTSTRRERLAQRGEAHARVGFRRSRLVAAAVVVAITAAAAFAVFAVITHTGSRPASSEKSPGPKRVTKAARVSVARRGRRPRNPADAGRRRRSTPQRPTAKADRRPATRRVSRHRPTLAGSTATPVPAARPSSPTSISVKPAPAATVAVTPSGSSDFGKEFGLDG